MIWLFIGWSRRKAKLTKQSLTSSLNKKKKKNETLTHASTLTMGSAFWFVSQTVSNFTQKLGENTLYGSSKENTSKYVSL